jgi:hypothetical protein
VDEKKLPLLCLFLAFRREPGLKKLQFDTPYIHLLISGHACILLLISELGLKKLQFDTPLLSPVCACV